MGHTTPPGWDQSHNTSREPSQPSLEAPGQVASTQAQLLAYAQDLARAYATQKLMAQYLPVDLRNRIIQGHPHVGGERRYVTVLFADLAGFTRLASRLDAEELFSLMNACFQRLASHISEYGGIIDKFMGDGLMAIFGAPVAHEDDPQRAVRAALDMQAEMEAFSAEMQPRLGTPLQLHIGINSGEVVAGSIGVGGHLAYTVMGETVNLAFRLQELAEPGSILVGEAVYRQTEHLYDYRCLGDFEVKGFERPLPIFSVGAAREVRISAQPLGDISLPWTGRERDVAHLRDLSQRLVTGQGGVVVISGEAGLGKTRLVQEWLATLSPAQVTTWCGAAQMFQQHISYSVWRDLLCHALHLRPGKVSPDEVTTRQVLLGQLGELAPFVLTLVHNRTPESKPHLNPKNVASQTCQAVRDLLVAQAGHQPLILIMDNWQWADDLSQDLLLALLPLSDQHTILFCIVSRSGIESTQVMVRGIEAQLGHPCQRIELSPLQPEDSWKLLSSLIVTEDVTETVQAIILSRVQSNPLYLKELLRLMVAEGIVAEWPERAKAGTHPDSQHPESGVARTGQGTGTGYRWRLVYPQQLASLRIPPTLRGLAQANLDRLPIELQEIVNYAAVIGSTFSVGLLQAVIAREQEISGLSARLQALVDRGIIEPGTANGLTFAFRHPLVQETAYNRLLSHRRQVLHRLVADELEILPEGDADASLELITYHFLQAGALAKAIPYLIRAGHRARNRSAHKAAIEHYLTALAALKDAPRYEGERLDLEMALGDAYSQLGQHVEAAAHYQSALDLTLQPEKRADIYRLLAGTYAAKHDWGQAWMWLEQALECLASGPVAATSVVRGQIYAHCAQVEWHQGNQQQAELWAREAIAILEGTLFHDSLAISYELLSTVYANLGRNNLAKKHAAQAQALRQGRWA
jgi:class 3 adenylate cyclase/tetratricopeptide (TPR) repeat protein